MKKLLAIGLLAVAQTASAEIVSGTVISSNGNYQTMTRQIPNQVCNTEMVPVYGEQKSKGITGAIVDGGFGSTEGMVGGIVGGVIGNQIGRGRGKDAATVAGVLIGSQIGNKQAQQNNVVGYREVQRCSTQYSTEQYEKLVSFTTTVEVDGTSISFTSPRKYKIGEHVTMNKRYTLAR